ncbi:MAG: GGDEF domain-containing protein [Proteobacteria bacterium]|nr:GGDEF domain-containing protein [Pseudomonadota bacterium]
MSRYSGSIGAQVKSESLATISSAGESTLDEAIARAKIGDVDSAASVLDQAQKLIDAQRRRIAYLENLAMADEVTSLVNRRGFMAALQRELASAKRDPGAYGLVLMFDLDRFKSVNDTYGHAAGDAYLAAFGAALAAEVRPSDIVARLSGDEFAVILTRAAPKPGMARAMTVAKNLNSKSMSWRDRSLPFSASMGVSCFTGRDIAEAVMVSADLKLYADKKKRQKTFGQKN